jgi:hypothetical protein
VPKVSLWFKVLLYFYFCFFILITRSSVRDFFMVLLWGLLFCFSLVDCTFFLVSCIFFAVFECVILEGNQCCFIFIVLIEWMRLKK